MRSAEPWSSDALGQALAPELAGCAVEVLAQIDSTNSELMRRARAGALAPVLLVAEQQTAGRGRLGRVWHSDAGAGASRAGAGSLTFSLGLALSPPDWSGLSLAVGASIAESLHPDLRLKWPNDVWLHGRKLAGILLETANVGDARYVVVGVGINLAQPDAAGLATAPAWLGEVMPQITGPQALALIAPTLVRAIKIFEASGFLPFQSRFNARDALSGLSVTLSDGTVGMAQGVDATGALQVQTGHGLKKITSSEVSVRPRAGKIV